MVLLQGKMSRILAAKAALATRVDAMGSSDDATIGLESRAKVCDVALCGHISQGLCLLWRHTSGISVPLTGRKVWQMLTR
jgi:snoRNA binding domain, fibrillarin